MRVVIIIIGMLYLAMSAYFAVRIMTLKNKINHELSCHRDIILDWILLPHSHYWNMCDKKILIISNEKQRKEKVMMRDGISNEYLENRDSAGISYDDIMFDEIIRNEYKEL